jgi:hypothetical protein
VFIKSLFFFIIFIIFILPLYYTDNVEYVTSFHDRTYNTSCLYRRFSLDNRIVKFMK